MADALVPVPDPTFLTTEQLSRGLTNLRELLEARINAVEEAAHHRYEDLRRVPTETDRQVVHLKELFNEKLTSVQKQFDERDIRSQARFAQATLSGRTSRFGCRTAASRG